MLITAGCMIFRDVDVPNRIVVPNSELPAPESGNLLQASLQLQAQSTQMVHRFESEAGIDRNVWSSDMWRAMRSPQTGAVQAQFSTAQSSEYENRVSTQRPETDRNSGTGTLFIFSEHMNDITTEVQRVAWNGHRFYFISKAVNNSPVAHAGIQNQNSGNDGSGLYHKVYVVDENGRGVASFKTGEVEPVKGAKNRPPTAPSRPLMYNVVVTEKGPWVLYRDRDGVFARPLVFDIPNSTSDGTFHQQRQHSGSGHTAQLADNRGSFAFGEPLLVSRAKLPYGRFQFVARVDEQDNFHVIWTDRRQGDLSLASNRHSLWYCRFDPETGEACRRPERLSTYTNIKPINLMVSGDEIYVSWIDNRFTRGWWTRRNHSKLFVARSGDRGSSFSSPVSIHPPEDNDERALFALTMPAPDEGILVFWSNQFSNNYFLDQDLNYGLLQPDMETFLLAEDLISGEELYKTILKNLQNYHHSLAGR